MNPRSLFEFHSTNSRKWLSISCPTNRRMSVSGGYNSSESQRLTRQLDQIFSWKTISAQLRPRGATSEPVEKVLYLRNAWLVPQKVDPGCDTQPVGNFKQNQNRRSEACGSYDISSEHVEKRHSRVDASLLEGASLYTQFQADKASLRPVVNLLSCIK